MPEEAQETFSDLRENTEIFLNNVLKRAQENLSKEFKKMFDQERRSFNDDMEVKA